MCLKIAHLLEQDRVKDNHENIRIVRELYIHTYTHSQVVTYILCLHFMLITKRRNVDVDTYKYCFNTFLKCIIGINEFDINNQKQHKFHLFSLQDLYIFIFSISLLD